MNHRLLILLLGDVFLSVISIYIGSLLRFGSITYIEGILDAKTIVVTAVLIFSSFLMGLYSYDNNISKKEAALKILGGTTLSFIALSSFYYFLPDFMFSRGLLLLSLITFSFSQFIWHFGYKYCIHLPTFAQRILIVGTGPLAKNIGDIITNTNHSYCLAGYIDCHANTPTLPPVNKNDNGNGNGNGNKIIEAAKLKKANKIVVSLTERRGALPLQDLISCKLSGIEVLDAPSFYEELTGKLLIENITPSWLIFSSGFKITLSKKILKRTFDIIFAIICALIVFPFIPLIALMIKIDSHGPVFLRQKRIGKNEKIFTLYKFRTMLENAEKDTGVVWAQKDDPRITRIGKLLRKTRLDEIPQIFNILKGDMSFVGPRPERPEFVETLKERVPYYSERHFVKPGLTGWAQVRYRYGSSVEDALEKLRYDLFYIKHISFHFDLLIILETIKVVLFGKGSR